MPPPSRSTNQPEVNPVPSDTISEFSVTHLPVFYRKELGKNAYRDNIGHCRSEWLVRVRSSSGAEGMSLANRYVESPNGSVAGLIAILREGLLGQRVDELLTLDSHRVTGVGSPVKRLVRDQPWLSVALFDLVAREHAVSCIELLGGRHHDVVPAYDTTLYFQDFLNPKNGAGQCAAEAADAKASGYRAAKLKMGRGGRWMLPEAGMRRDVEVLHAVREEVGEDFALMVDANFGYDGRLDLLEDFFRETASAKVFWFEEMVTANVPDYRRLRAFQERYAPDALLVCGEVDRTPISPVFQDLIDEGLIDGYQPDVVGAGFAKWMEIERQLEGTSVRSIPHDFGNGRFGTRAGQIFGAACKTFVSLEDERQLDHVYKPDAFPLRDGAYQVGEVVGLALEIDEERFQRDHAHHTFVVRD